MGNEITSLEWSRVLEIAHTKARRYFREFLPTDPRARTRSGYTRRVGLNDGFIVFLGATLVSDLNLLIPEARRILDTLKPWLEKIGLLPQSSVNVKVDGKSSAMPTFQVSINRLIDHPGEFKLTFRASLPTKPSKTEIEISGEKYRVWEEPHFEDWILPPFSKERIGRTMTANDLEIKVLNLSHLLVEFRYRMGLLARP